MISFTLSLKEFIIHKNALQKGVSIETEREYQSLSYDGIFSTLDLELVDFIQKIEELFNIQIEDSKIETFNSVNDILIYIQTKNIQ